MNKNKKIIVVGLLSDELYIKLHNQSRRVYSEDGIAPTIHTAGGGNIEPKVMVKEDKNIDIIQYPRGQNKGGVVGSEISPTITGSAFEQNVFIGAFRGRNPENPSNRTAGIPAEQRLEIGGDISNTLTMVLEPKIRYKKPLNRQGWHRKACEVLDVDEITEEEKSSLYRVRKLTPKECWRLMGFTDEDFDRAKWHSKEYSEEFLSKHPEYKGKMSHDGRIERVSNSQLYKQAGNSIVVNVLEAIFRELI